MQLKQETIVRKIFLDKRLKPQEKLIWTKQQSRTPVKYSNKENYLIQGKWINQKLNNFLASATSKHTHTKTKYVSEGESKYICNYTNSF